MKKAFREAKYVETIIIIIHVVKLILVKVELI